MNLYIAKKGDDIVYGTLLELSDLMKYIPSSIKHHAEIKKPLSNGYSVRVFEYCYQIERFGKVVFRGNEDDMAIYFGCSRDSVKQRIKAGEYLDLVICKVFVVGKKIMRYDDVIKDKRVELNQIFQ